VVSEVDKAVWEQLTRQQICRRIWRALRSQKLNMC